MSITGINSVSQNSNPITFGLESSSLNPIIPEIPTTPTNNFERVFSGTDQMKQSFIKFLQTIFFRLDEKKVMKIMEEFFSNGPKNDDEAYQFLLENVKSMKKPFSPLLAIHSLINVLKPGMGKQVKELLKGFIPGKFHDYIEVYDRRYLNTIRKIVGMPLDGQTIAYSDSNEQSIIDKLQAGALLSSFPYKSHVPLNDDDCVDPLATPEKSHRPIQDQVDDESLDLVACLGGLHHIPENRVEAFVENLGKKLKPGAVFLIRDHNVDNDDIKVIASVVHSFVNAADGVSLEIEKKEIREFKPLSYWTNLMERHQLKRISPKELILEDDPTANGMIAFVKTCKNNEELKKAAEYRKEANWPLNKSSGSWIEWGNVRLSKEYAEFINTHHDFQFDYMGSIKQHWKHYYHFIKENRTNGSKLSELIFSDSFIMSTFILFSAIISNGIGAITTAPSRLIAQCKHKENWRNVINLTNLEKLQAEVELDYSKFIDEKPFYSYSYLETIKKLWLSYGSSQTKTKDFVRACSWTFELLMKATISFPIRLVYSNPTYIEPETVEVIVKDPENQVNELSDKITVIQEAEDGSKLISVPRYKPFTEICKKLKTSSTLKFEEIAGRKEISIDVIQSENENDPDVEGIRRVYETRKLHTDESSNNRYVTYFVPVDKLAEFHEKTTIYHVHE